MASFDCRSGTSCCATALLLLTLVGLALPAAARTFCCTDDNGHRLCGDVVPRECTNRAYQELDAMGVVSRLHEAPLTPDQRLQRAAELARKKEADRRAEEQKRRDRALLASYTSAQDIDAKLERTVAEGNAILKALQERQAIALARKQQLAEEAEFFQKKPMPAALKTSIRENDAEVSGLQAAIEDRKSDLVAAQVRFAQEKQRYLMLIGNNKSGQTEPTPARPR